MIDDTVQRIIIIKLIIYIVQERDCPEEGYE